ncbi:alkaline phosphatase D family protein [Actinomycetospora rhizophila]|uniref:Alkaline phosphatase D family protein n=1 Tax=Actinomycetospora rhizophila TaxID=1416876 RepID=A0ABV9ZCL9_9PSEU
MTSLELGPLLRHVGTTTATIWVETSASCTVEVLGASAPTFEVCGQHYALVVVDGLEPGTCRSYEVRLDGELVWPLEGTGTPPSYLRTRAEDSTGRLRFVFGSCRYPPTDDPELEASLGIDALDAFAVRLMDEVADAEDPATVLPDALCLLGDQVYADEITPRTEQWIRDHRDPEDPEGPGLEIADFGEYSHLYSESWSDRELRWLLSTVPTAMIFDDHDVRDDWNTSQVWRDQMAAKPWWPQRIRAGLASYWVYQHLGNLDPETRGADPLYRKVREADGDVYELLADFAARADAEVGQPTGVRWSYRWDLGRTRLLMVDTRCARVLNADDRLMINDHSFAWIEESAADGPLDHLLLGSSIPWLMPPAVSHVQSLDEWAAARGSRLAETVRQAVDLEHWPAFRASFDRLADLIRGVASGPSAPATVCVLSGDVHHSYAAEARWPSPVRSRVYQLTCSPVRNGVPWFMEYVFALGWWRRLTGALNRVSRAAGLGDLPLDWSTIGGPWFGNAVSTLEVTGRDARLRVERSGARGGLEEVAQLPLT